MTSERQKPTPTGRESPFGDDEIIVTKTDTTSHIRYANDVFLRVSRLSRSEVLGKPHNLIRHPDMPRCIFQMLWRTLQAKGEFFGYVVNLAANGDHYWVFAHVSASLDQAGQVIGYHSMRRKPDADRLARIQPIYRALLAEEARHQDRNLGMARASAMFERMLDDRKMTYDEFAFAV